jgi:hypothetical protein
VSIFQDFDTCAIFSNRHKKGGALVVITKTLNFENTKKNVITSKYNVTVRKFQTVLLTLAYIRESVMDAGLTQ